MAVFAEAVLAMMVLLSQVTGELRNLFDLSEGRDELSSVLRFYVWGGPEGVAIFQRMADAGHRSLQDAEGAALAWPQLVELVRGLLDEPTAVRNCCMPMRELSLRYVADRSEESDSRLGQLFLKARARQFTRRIATYIVDVGKLPPDFAKRLDSDVDCLAEPVERGGALSTAPLPAT